MDTSALNWIPIICSLVSVVAGVICIQAVRRGADAELKADLNELAGTVERITKENRRERMRRVRAGEKDSAQPFPIPPGAENVPLETSDATVTAIADKSELRRRARLVGRG